MIETMSWIGIFIFRHVSSIQKRNFSRKTKAKIGYKSQAIQAQGYE